MTTTPTEWLAPFQVNTSDGAAGSNDQYQSAVTELTGGRFLVVWLDTQDIIGIGPPDINAQIFDALGNPIGPELKFINSFIDFEQDLPVVTALPDGGFLVTYQSTSADLTPDQNIITDRFDANGSPVVAPNTTAFTEAEETAHFLWRAETIYRIGCPPQATDTLWVPRFCG